MPPVQPATPAQPGTVTGPNGMPMVQQVNKLPEPGKDKSGLIKTIVIIILSLVSVTFIGLFIWMFLQFNEVNTDQEGKKAAAVEQAKYEQKEADLKQFAEDEKYPLRAFVGPADYGGLSFKYPKTWSVYVAKDANNGGDYEAYLNPLVVEPVSKDTINALRVTIRDAGFDAVASEYERVMKQNDSNLTMDSVEINGITMNRYTGTIPGTELNGIVVIFKIRDKTAVMQTDTVLFKDDFDSLLETVEFNA